MSLVKRVFAGIFGILFLAALVGYSGEEVINEVPKPGAGLCGVTKESYDTVPGSGAFLDIEVEVSWDDDTVWIGIITVEDYDSLEKLGGNSEGEIVSCEARIDFVAGGPASGESSQFDWIPDGEEFHIMIGSLEEADEDDDDEEDNPWPFDENVESKSFVDEFNVTVEYDISGGWGTLVIIMAIETTLLYLVLLNNSNQEI